MYTYMYIGYWFICYNNAIGLILIGIGSYRPIFLPIYELHLRRHIHHL